jgi:hypothetical protein
MELLVATANLINEMTHASRIPGTGLEELLLVAASVRTIVLY